MSNLGLLLCCPQFPLISWAQAQVFSFSSSFFINSADFEGYTPHALQKTDKNEATAMLPH